MVWFERTYPKLEKQKRVPMVSVEKIKQKKRDPQADDPLVLLLIAGCLWGDVLNVHGITLFTSRAGTLLGLLLQC